MNKKELVAAVAEAADMTKDSAGEAVDQVFDCIQTALKDGDEVRIPGFGSFKVTRREAREGVNPATGKKIKIKATNVPKFQAGKGLKDAVN